MNKLLLSISLCLLAFCLTAKDAIPFQEQNFHTVQAEAEQQNKSFFIFYYGKGCIPCQMMKENTFEQDHIINMVTKDFIAAKVDLESTLGRDWVEHSETLIMYMPTIVFFSPQGKVLNKYEEWLTPSKFETILKENKTKGQSPSTKTLAQKQHRSTPSKVYAANKNKKSNPYIKARRTTNKSKKLSAHNRQIAIKKIPNQTTYMVQAGLFRNTSNLKTAILKLQQQTNRKDIFYIKETTNSGSTYRILIGENHSISEARRIVSNCKKKGITVFVKKI